MIEPIEIIIPEGTILNAAYPAATTFGNHLCPPNADAIIRALAPVHSRARDRGLEPAAVLALHRPRPAQASDTYVDILFMGLKGGSGATLRLRRLRPHRHDRRLGRRARPGLRDVRADDAAPAARARVPRRTRPGPGKHRGGLGVETRYLVGGDDTQIVTFGDGDIEPAFGLVGGGDGTLNFIELH